MISWSSVSPFTACVIAKRIEQSIKWGILWCAVIAFAYGYEAYNETHERHGAALIAQAWHTGSDNDFHVVEVWTWQIYFYALATKIGVTLNACLLMYLLRSKTDNAVQAHKMLACAIMPPPVAKEVFEIQWKRLREGQRASRAATATKQRSGSVSIVSRVLNYVFANAGAGSSGGSRSGSGSRSRSFSGSSFTSRSSSSWSWGGIVRGKGKQAPGGSDHSHTSGDSHSDGAATSSHDDGFEWTDDDYIAKRRQGGGSEGDARGNSRLESLSSTRAELAMDTTRGLADFAPTPTRSSLDEVKLEIPEDDDVDAGEGASGELAAHKELTNLRQVSFSGTLATERVFERSAESEKSLRNPTLDCTHASRRDRRSMAHTIARDHPSVTVIFIDIVGFSEMCEHVKPKAVLRFLEHYFELVDKMAEEHGVTKVRTVGDGYLAVTGLMAEMGVPEDSHQHTFGLGVLLELRDVGLKLPTGRPVRARIGLADGNVFSGVVGKTCMQYDIFGNVANLAVCLF